MLFLIGWEHERPHHQRPPRGPARPYRWPRLPALIPSTLLAVSPPVGGGMRRLLRWLFGKSPQEIPNLRFPSIPMIDRRVRAARRIT